MFKRNLVVGLIAALAVACGGSDPGSGTKTLHVNGTLFSDGSPTGTWISLAVREGHANGGIIEDAVVLLTPQGGNEIPVPFTIFRQNFKNEFAWAKSYRLKVTRGNDKLEALIEPPGLTTITAPAAGSVYNRAAGTPLRVTWVDSFERRAQQVTVELDDGQFSSSSQEILTNGDELFYDIPSSSWTSPTTSERVRITRRFSLSLAGGSPGSTLTAETTHRTNDFTVQ